MTRFFDLSAGELREFERVCAEHLSAENARSIIRDPAFLR